MIVGIIGLGLIGGSFALDLKTSGISIKILGFDIKEKHIEEAKLLNIIDEESSIENMIKNAVLIVLAIPVNYIPEKLKTILNEIKENQIIIDLGSTKQNIAQKIAEHHNRKNYVACHPIAGTENTGPSAAFTGLFKGKVNIICDKHLSSSDALQKIESIFDKIGMKTIYMDSKEHDKHIAYVSHLSHISSFALGKTVLEIEESEKNIFNMAGSGFASTVRLAKSSPDMWSPIFDQNAENLSVALGAYIDNLIEFKQYIDNHQTDKTHQLMTNVNDIKRVLKGIELNN